MFVVPGIFADGQGHAVAAEIEKLLAASRREIAHFIEYIVGGQQHLGLQKDLLAILQQCCGVHDRLAGLRIGGSYQAANYRDALAFCRYALNRLAILRHERRPFHQITWRIAADGQLRKQDQSSARRSRPLGEINDLGCVSGKVPYRGIDLAEGNFHSSSLKPLGQSRQVYELVQNQVGRRTRGIGIGSAPGVRVPRSRTWVRRGSRRVFRFFSGPP